MGEGKSNTDNGKRQNKNSIQDDVNNQFKDINESDSTKQLLSDAVDTPKNCDIKSLADNAVNINILRYELDRAQLDFKAKVYFENDVKPLIDTLYSLSYASSNYSATAKNLAGINFGRSSKIKDAIDLAEGVNEISEDLIEVLKCKIDNMLKLSKHDCK